jgi:hypothetical protein
MSRKDAIRDLAKDFIKFAQKEDNKNQAFTTWHNKLQSDLAKQIKYELENLHNIANSRLVRPPE